MSLSLRAIEVWMNIGDPQSVHAHLPSAKTSSNSSSHRQQFAPRGMQILPMRIVEMRNACENGRWNGPLARRGPEGADQVGGRPTWPGFTRMAGQSNPASMSSSMRREIYEGHKRALMRVSP